MGIKQWLETGAVIGAMVLAPATSMAMQRRASCTAGPATPESYTWNFSREASGLLNDMRADANQVANQAAQLENFSRNPEVDWQLDADYLVQIKQEVNDMGKRLCRLETIKRVTAPWEQDAIRRTAPLVQYMADNTEDAINYVNAHENQLWTPPYRVYAQNLDTEAHTLAHRINNQEEVAHLNQQLARVENNAGAHS
jgi:hypothetical protein